MYSGDMVYSHNLITLKGRNNMDITLTLNYSSNVLLNVRAGNDIAPTGWLGLGWRLGFGGIVCNHKGTKTHADDEFSWISTTGVSSRLFRKNNTFFLETEPYFKVETVDNNTDGIIDQWIITATDGIRYVYGNQSDSDERRATRYTFSWAQHVGSGRNEEPQLFPYRWDICEIADGFNNKTQFYYSQKTEKLASGNWQSVKEYTKASYLSKVVNPQGKRVECILQSKGNECFDPNRINPEPDNYIEMYEDSCLKEIKVYLHPRIHNAVKTYTFEYIHINETELGTLYKKSLLSSINEYDGTGTTLLTKTAFDYHTDMSYADDTSSRYNDNYHYGALHTISASGGSQISFEYTKKEITSSKQVCFDSPGGIWHCSRGTYGPNHYPYYLVQGDRWVWLYTWNGSSWDNPIDQDDFGSTAGKNFLTAGHNFFTVGSSFDDHPNDYMWGFHWNAKEWVYSHIKVRDNDPVLFKDYQIDGQTRDKKVRLHDDYLVVTTRVGDIKDEYIFLFQWNGSYWESQDVVCGTNFGHKESKSVYPMDEHLVVLSGYDYVNVYDRIGDTWQLSSVKIGDADIMPFNTNLYQDKYKEVFTGDNYFVVAFTDGDPDDNNRAHVALFQWNGSYWETKPLKDGDGWHTTFGHTKGVKSAYCMPEYCVITSGYPKTGDKKYNEYIYVVNRDGSNWKLAKLRIGDEIHDFATNFGEFNNHKSVFPHQKTLAVSCAAGSHSDIENYIFLLQWNGVEWQSQPLPANTGIPSSGTTVNGTNLGNDAYKKQALFFGNHCFIDGAAYVYDFQFDGEQWVPDEDIMGAHLGTVSPKAIHYGNNFFVSKPEPYNSFSIYIWDGKKWVCNVCNENLGDVFEKNIEPQHVYLGDNLFIRHAQHASKLSSFFKFQNSFTENIYTYVIDKKTVSSTIPAIPSVTTEYFFDPSSATYDSRGGVAKFNRVETRVPDNGKIIQYFFNDSKADAQDGLSEDYTLLDGKNYKTELVSDQGVVRSQSKNDFSVHAKSSWPQYLFQVRSAGTAAIKHAITYETEAIFNVDNCYDDVNGIPRFTVSRFNDASSTVNYTLFAGEVAEYASGMGVSGAYKLTWPALQLFLEDFSVTAGSVCPSNWYQSISKNYLRSASVTTWSNQYNPGGVWMPYATYTWNAAMDQQGKPVVNFPGFDFSDSAANVHNHWQLQNAVTRYNAYGQVLESKTENIHGPVYTSSFYRGDISLPMASVHNAGFAECGFFTADYDQDSASYFDFDNAWEKGAVFADGELMVTDTRPHFGQRSLRVKNSFGPTKNIALRDIHQRYVFCAWVYPQSSEAIRFAVEIRDSATGAPIDNQRKDTLVSGLHLNQWQLVYHSFDLADNTGIDGRGEYFRIWIGNGPDDSPADFLVDDIRFYPEKASVTTHFYDTIFLRPVCTVDQNNHPDGFVAYDGFGRPLKTYAILENGQRVLLQETEYHVMHE